MLFTECKSPLSLSLFFFLVKLLDNVVQFKKKKVIKIEDVTIERGNLTLEIGRKSPR